MIIGQDARIDPGASRLNVGLQFRHHPREGPAWRRFVIASMARLALIDIGGDQDRIVIPHGAVGVDERRNTEARGEDHLRDLVEQYSCLFGIEQEIPDFTHTISIGHGEFRMRKDVVVQRPPATAPAISSGPGQIQVPIDHAPARRLWIMEKEIVLAGVVVVVMNRLHDGTPAVILVEIKI